MRGSQQICQSQRQSQQKLKLARGQSPFAIEAWTAVILSGVNASAASVHAAEGAYNLLELLSCRLYSREYSSLFACSTII